MNSWNYRFNPDQLLTINRVDRQGATVSTPLEEEKQKGKF